MSLNLTSKSIGLLKKLIATKSFSGEENGTALLISNWLKSENIAFERSNNNIWAKNKYFDAANNFT